MDQTPATGNVASLACADYSAFALFQANQGLAACRNAEGFLSRVLPILIHRAVRPAAHALQSAEPHQPSGGFIPQPEAQGPEALEERQRPDVAEQRLGAVAALQVVVRDARTQVMDVVEADVPGEPLQDARQLEVRAA